LLLYSLSINQKFIKKPKDTINKMIIIHEHMPIEAQIVARELKKVYQFPSNLINSNLDNLFVPVQKFEGFLDSAFEIHTALRDELKKRKVLILTDKDIYLDGQSQLDDWIFGYQTGSLAVVSTARMKRSDNLPSKELIVPKELYTNRLLFLAIHEVGHDVVKSPLFKQATWVNAKTNYKVELGPHCTNNSCTMYEIVDIPTPSKDEGYMILGAEKKFDAGLDEVLTRVSSSWLCDSCQSHIQVEKKYFK
jgi:predicted Zn-dependent protease